MLIIIKKKSLEVTLYLFNVSHWQYRYFEDSHPK